MDVDEDEPKQQKVADEYEVFLSNDNERSEFVAEVLEEQHAIAEALRSDVNFVNIVTFDPVATVKRPKNLEQPSSMENVLEDERLKDYNIPDITNRPKRERKQNMKLLKTPLLEWSYPKPEEPAPPKPKRRRRR